MKWFILAIVIVIVLSQDPVINDITKENNDQQNTSSPTDNNSNENSNNGFLSEEDNKTSKPKENSTGIAQSFSNFKDYQYEVSFTVKPIEYVIISSIILAFILIFATIGAFCKVPLRKGYKCRGCERFKWFFILVLYFIFSPFIFVHYCINGIVGCLHGICPDKKIEDCKLDEEPEPAVQKKKIDNNGTYKDLNEEEKQNEH